MDKDQKQVKPEIPKQYNLKLNQGTSTSEKVHIRRVPGGWIYTNLAVPQPTSVFVPMNGEFLPKVQDEPKPLIDQVMELDDKQFENFKTNVGQMQEAIATRENPKPKNDPDQNKPAPVKKLTPKPKPKRKK